MGWEKYHMKRFMNVLHKLFNREDVDEEAAYRLKLVKKYGCFIDENGQILTSSDKTYNKVREHYKNVDFWNGVSDYSIDDVYTGIEEKVKSFLDRKFLTIYGKDHTLFSVACGSGENEFYLANYVKSIDGYEYSSKMVQTATQRADELKFNNLTFLQADLGSYDINKVYDAGLCFFLFAYLEDNQVKHAISTMSGALKQGGRLYLRDTLNYAEEPAIYLYNYATGYSAKYRDIETYKKMLEKEGLYLEYEEVLKTSNTGGYEFKLINSVWVKR